MRIAEADLVPTDANLLAAYCSFSELVDACEAFCDLVNGREHRSTRRVPKVMLSEERLAMHPPPQHPYTAVFGVTRTVGSNIPVIAFDGGEYSVPKHLRGDVVWARHHGDQIVVTAVDRSGAHEVARHLVTTPGNPRYVDEHFGPAPEGPLNRTRRGPRTTTGCATIRLVRARRWSRRPIWRTGCSMSGVDRGAATVLRG